MSILTEILYIFKVK